MSTILFPITLLYASLLGLIFIGLSMLVIRARFKNRVSIGHGNDKTLETWIRIHGNFAEYTPIFLILLALLEAAGQSAQFLYILGGAFVVCRLSHVIGLLMRKAPNPPRAIGIIGTMTLIVIAAVSGLLKLL